MSTSFPLWGCGRPCVGCPWRLQAFVGNRLPSASWSQPSKLVGRLRRISIASWILTWPLRGTNSGASTTRGKPACFMGSRSRRVMRQRTLRCGWHRRRRTHPMPSNGKRALSLTLWSTSSASQALISDSTSSSGMTSIPCMRRWQHPVGISVCSGMVSSWTNRTTRPVRHSPRRIMLCGSTPTA
ncbi:unnamed protein product [Symbiodinium sp. KB8]|nr:unnamed protein product [Symbiodinium sp. KB8]